MIQILNPLNGQTSKLMHCITYLKYAPHCIASKTNSTSNTKRIHMSGRIEISEVFAEFHGLLMHGASQKQKTDVDEIHLPNPPMRSVDIPEI